MPAKKKHYLYHWKSSNFQGDFIHPLNALKDLHPGVYQEQVKKYRGRESIMRQLVHPLQVLWNDVIHLTAIHPREVRRELEKAGHPQPPWESFEIDPHELDPKRTAVYLDPNRRGLAKPEHFEPFDPNDIEKHGRLPEETKAYYREMKKEGERPFIYAGTSHILYRGSIPVKGKKIIRLK